LVIIALEKFIGNRCSATAKLCAEGPIPAVSGCSNPSMRETPALLDHLIGSGEQGCRHGEVEHPGGLGIDDQLELARP
jgi:hypothetical protein